MAITGLQEPRQLLPGRRILVLQNPGRGSRNCLDGMIAAMRRMNLGVCILELSGVWAMYKTDPTGLVNKMSQILVQERIGAALSYGFNGVPDFPLDDPPFEGLKGLKSFLEIRGVPHLLWWLDHPHWHSDQAAFSPALQAILRSANNIHYLKSTAHALDLERMLGWSNCFGLPVGVALEQFPVVATQEGAKEFDLVAICGEGGDMPVWLGEFVAMEDPDPEAIRKVIEQNVLRSLEELWKTQTPQGLHAELSALGKKWVALKMAEPFRAAMRYWAMLTEEFPGACWYLTLAYPVYMKASQILWRFREWERRFYMAYLAKYFKVGVFGGDWSKMGLGPGGWVDYLEQSKTYARGKVALSIIDGHDEEGLTLKPFEIAASGVPCLHYRAEGLAECFEPGVEMEVFERPKEAREKLSGMLKDEKGRARMAGLARERVVLEHTWEKRVAEMLRLARLPIEAFRSG